MAEFSSEPPAHEKEAPEQQHAMKTNGVHSQSGAAAAAAAVGVWYLAFQSVGVVYGDVGTSPLYVFSSTFANGIIPNRDDILGSVSLIFWTLVLLPLVKYALIVMNANDNGNGGTFALYSFICRHARVSQLPPGEHQANHKTMSLYNDGACLFQDRHPLRAAKIRDFLERSRFAKQFLLIITLLGTCAVIGDGILTPSISVLSAIDGIQTKFPSLTNDSVAWISIAILIGLFSLQRFGTAKVGWLFAPFLLLWFVCILTIGIYNIAMHEWRVLYAFNPYYIAKYFTNRGTQAWISLGGIILCITGTEAMFADVSHFSVESIRRSLGCIVIPSLIAAYFGQGAYLIKYPEDVAQTFYKSIPPYSFIFWPMFAIAVISAIIASQAMISATFSIVEQSQALGCFPRVKIVHTSKSMLGQIYVPEVNWILMILCVAVTGIFKTTTLIGNAYGIAVLAVMLVTTFLLTLIMLFIWQTPTPWAIAFPTVFFTIELIYFSSNLYKFDQGGYIPIAFAGVLLFIMCIWHYVSKKKYEYEASHTVSDQDLLMQTHKGRRCPVVPGIGLVYTRQIQGVPPMYSHFLENVHTMHAVVVLVTIKILPVAIVPIEERFLVSRVGKGLHDRQWVYRCIARYGYMEGSSRARKAFQEGELPESSSVEFEQALMASLRRFIVEDANKSEVVIDCEESDEILGKEADDEEASPRSRKTQMGIVETVQEEVAFLEDCRREGGVTYMLGKPEVRAAPNSGKFKSFIVDVLYDALHRVCRTASLSLPVPPERLLKVAMIYEV